MALRRQRPGADLILHSDRGSEFANAKYHRRAADAHIRLSMRSSGNGYDNAAAESLVATVKLEAVRGEFFASRQVAR